MARPATPDDRFDRLEQRCEGEGTSIVLHTFDEQRVDDVVVDQFEILMANPMLDVSLTTGEEIVGNDHLVTFEHQTIDQMRADKAKIEG